MDPIFEQIKLEAEKYLSCSAHGMDHCMRVYFLALQIAEDENIDLEILQAAAILHDIGGGKETADPTGQTDHALEGAIMARHILEQLNFPQEKIQHVQDCISTHRFKANRIPQTKEAQIIFEADKIDALGAVGVARHFIWIGNNKAHMYKKQNIEKYIQENMHEKRIMDKTKHSPQIEYEIKIKHIINKIKTPKGRQICKERTEFFKNFLDRLEEEAKYTP